MTITRSSDTSCWVFRDVSSKACSGSIDTAFTDDEASAKEPLRNFSSCVCNVAVSPFVRDSGRVSLVRIESCVKTPILARSVFVLRGHRLHRHNVVVMICLCCDLQVWYFTYYI